MKTKNWITQISCTLLWMALSFGGMAQSDTTNTPTGIEIWEDKYSEVKTDSSSLEVRHFSPELIDEFRDDEDYQYDPPPAIEGNSLKDWINNWVKGFVSRFLGDSESTKWLVNSIYLAAGVILLHFLFKLFGVDMRGILQRKSDSINIKQDIGAEDIHQRDFPNEIQQSVSKQRYREAIRLQYLHSLKLLSDKNIIQWEIDKTNQEYTVEVQTVRLKTPFRDITDIFEHVYYGDFPVSESFYHRTANNFLEFKSLVEQA